MSASLAQSYSVLTNRSLHSLNSLKLESVAEEYVHITSADQLVEATNYSGPLHFLGGGSNLLLLPRVRGRMLHIGIRGVTITRESKDKYLVRVGAGENWHQFVLHTLRQGIGGLENLALIPGNVGGAPYQNIGAYGRELAELIHSVEVFDLINKKSRVLSNEACQFSYRNSVFRATGTPQLVITHVNFLLGGVPLMAEYRDVRDSLSAYSEEEVDHDLIAETVISIRERKLPDLEKYPNVGSFFKNPTLTKQEYDHLRAKIEIVGYSQGVNVRVPAARLIDAQKWKGKQVGNVLVWHRQPLVLVNCGGASATEFISVAERISDDVEQHYGIRLLLEPVVMGSDN
ncbi:MAG: UDP-N-acetylmuramate dehydrogenase [Gammaproteobacteria bacterium]|nr:UDP-N-acetylmuramate dehydrogenase [Gammaproteobacteria bacterium]MYF38597.1 UDP-N-acetylmuramate dehydrogenase [Gammaproteobacteria bacterium]